MTRTVARGRLLGAGLVLACWTFLGALFVPQTYFLNLRAPTPLTFWQAVAGTLTLFYIWAALTPPVNWLCRRFPVERPHVLRYLSLTSARRSSSRSSTSSASATPTPFC